MNHHATAVTLDADLLAEIDAVAAASDRSRDDILREAIAQYLDARAWQTERIEAGLADIRKGRTRPGEEVFAEIAAKHGWRL